MRRMIFVLVFVFMLSLVALPLTSSASRAYETYPQVTISLTEQSKAAHVGPNESAIVTFQGLCSITFPSGYENPAAYINVSLFVEDTWGTAVVSPTSKLCTQHGDWLFKVTITVPAGTSFTNTGRVTVLGSWLMEPLGASGSANPQGGVTGRVDINQFFNFTLSCHQKKMTADIWERKEFELQIQNTGNFMDTFKIKVVNLKELSDKCISVMQTQSRVEILNNHTKKIRFRVTPGDTTECLGKHEIIVRVQSDKGIKRGVEAQNFTFELDVPEDQIINTQEFQNCFLVIIIVVVIVVFISWRRRRRRRKEVVRC